MAETSEVQYSMINRNPLKSSSKPGVPIKYRHLFLSAIITAGIFLIVIVNNRNEIIFLNEYPNTWKLEKNKITENDDRFTINTPGCTIPGLHAFDKSVAHFSAEAYDIQPCPKSNISLLIANETHIQVVEENFRYHNITDKNNFTCCYESFYRPLSIEDISRRSVDNRVKYNPCIEFKYSIKSNDEFVRVRCRNNNTIVQDEFFLFVIKKPFVSMRDLTTDNTKNSTPKYNVMIMGIDSVSRLNFYRTMPKTLEYLKKMNAIELQGYNKVGDNTFPNLIAMLLGIRAPELRRHCLPHYNSFFDGCPFLWERYKDAGYYTILMEDTSPSGTFNYNRYGFYGMPTDYYLHTFLSEANEQTGNSKHLNYRMCMGSQFFLKVLLNYADKLSSKLHPSSNFFGLFWESSISHDYVFYPKFMDSDYKNFLETMFKSDKMNNTILIVMSDHGIRWGPIRMTKQGRLEERLPFVFMLFPPSFKNKYKNAYNNLKLNQRRLTSPLDMHSTLEDLIELNNMSDSDITKRTNSAYGDKRSISLFLPIPKNRTCEMADIDEHWCTCHKGKKIDVMSKDAIAATHYLVSHLNTLLKNKEKCARLTLNEVIDITEMTAGNPDKNEKGWKEFLVTVRTLPGGGIFESTIRRELESEVFTVTGTVSRLNLYGRQSHCIDNPLLKLYCFCK